MRYTLKTLSCFDIILERDGQTTDGQNPYVIINIVRQHCCVRN